MSRINVSKIRVKVPRRRHSAQSENIRRWEPWKHTTGAKSEQGKRKVTKNLPLNACAEWRLVCSVLKLPVWHTFHVDVMVDAKTATKLSGKTGWSPHHPVHFRARVSKDRQRILFSSIEQKFTTDAEGKPMEDLREVRKRLDREIASIEKRLKEKP